MSVKVLHRRTKLGPSSIGLIKNMDPPVQYNPLPNIIEHMSSAFPHRKSADGEPLSVLSRVKEFIHFKKPDIDLGNIGDTLQKLKIPGLIILGVAFIAGLVFLAYKLYKNWNDKDAQHTINKIMADFKQTAPELFEIPGWEDQIQTGVTNAVYSGDEQTMVEGIAKIKTALINKQKSMGSHVGSGIDLFSESRQHLGRGVIMPL